MLFLLVFKWTKQEWYFFHFTFFVVVVVVLERAENVKMLTSTVRREVWNLKL